MLGIEMVGVNFGYITANCEFTACWNDDFAYIFRWVAYNIASGKVSYLTSAWMSNHIHDEVWDDIIYLFLNFNGSTVEVEEWISYFSPHFTGHVITYPCWNKIYFMLVNELMIMLIK